MYASEEGEATYSGGVLAQDGSVHFTPREASVGQKINSEGTVSTYNISSDVYVGGIISQEGDIHFIPRDASVGMKINIAAEADWSKISLSPYFNKF